MIAEYDELKNEFIKASRDFATFRDIVTKNLASFHHNEEVLVDNVERCLRGFENSELVVLAQVTLCMSLFLKRVMCGLSRRRKYRTSLA